MSEPSASAPLPRVLWPLLFGNFVIGTGVMVVPGTLNDISSNLQVSDLVSRTAVKRPGVHSHTPISISPSFDLKSVTEASN